MGEDFMKVMTWPFGEMLFPEKDTAGPDQQSAASSTPDTGKLQATESIEAQSAQRRLARLSKYFTSPTGVLQSPGGSTGLF